MCACQPLVFPRTAEIAKPKTVAVRASAQYLTIEPQRVALLDGTKASSTVGFIPDLDLDLAIGLGRCETAIVAVDFGLLAELRCAIVQQDHAPFSATFSGAAGVTASMPITAAPSARIGIDVSRRFGAVEPLIDVYLSTQRQTHFVQTGVVNDPIVAPVDIDVGRQEIRLSIPVGVAILARPQFHPNDTAFHGAVLGIVPWFVLAGGRHVDSDPSVVSYMIGGWGLSFTLGLTWR
jgi:hypothetical protein